MPNSTKTATYETWFKGFQITQSDFGPTEIVSQYLVRRLDDGVVNYAGQDGNQMITEGAHPVIGDLYIDTDPASARGTTAQLARCRAVQYQTADTIGRCLVTCTYSCQAMVDPKTIVAFGQSIPNPNPIKVYLPASIDFQTSFRSTRIWRTDPTTAPLGVDANNRPINVSSGDIGGDSVKNVAEGQEIEVAQTVIRLRILRDASLYKMEDQWSGLAAAPPTIPTAIDGLKEYVGRLHGNKPTVTGAVNPFFKFEKGTIQCRSVSMTKIEGSEYYEVNMEFVWDEYNFCDQQPELNPDGSIKMTTVGGTLKAANVFWVRKPFKGANFLTIFGQDPGLYDIVARGYWTP